MSDKIPGLPTLNFSMKSANKAPPKSVQRKPVMLHIKAIPDSNTIEVKHFDHDIGAFIYARSGNVKLLDNERLDGLDHSSLILGGLSPKPAEINPGDFAFNFISDPDQNSKALDDAIDFVEKNQIHCLNHPAKVKRMTRDWLYQQFGELEGVVIPKTLRVSPRYDSDIREMVEAGDISLPMIVRPAGGHDGKNMLLVESLDDIRELQSFAFNGSDYFLIEFQDYCGADGFYRKYRMMWINGKAYPRHLILDRKWNIHGKNRENHMVDNEQLRNEEIAFYKDPESSLGARNYALVHKIFTGIGLDYCGMDFSILPNGDLVIFEANAAMNAVSTDPTALHKESLIGDVFDYQNAYWQEQEKAKVSMLREAAALGVGSQSTPTN
ncbi:ATP-grasp domain-containing protein [Solemya velum gill symbiont]|uniref:ATP-grasp domain-containing protein n=1 Tax=Solemya velum gill symbiont TaxID=2340 RepID=UPI0009980AC2|nr:hypothetical protein [Solemya velum gill symbiont]OOY61210.1 hypothetical protein BOW02_02110 [Solemya velum gill symbiont]OOY75960.1 hypothetical protein BOW09_00590 [Solemya velum gill symbiont]OOY78217.1 hypothetical protein BOW10_01605 [Solemya velum gill symbiont]OOY83186.1 hypothetical protein BOW12_01710 [Solemya velum gill symbiont]OOY86120.1 hypothetical protein BOW13_02905 [Solemya velum gill symbiont]